MEKKSSGRTTQEEARGKSSAMIFQKCKQFISELLSGVRLKEKTSVR